MPERSRLPFIDLLNLIGLNTKSSNEIKNDLSVSTSDNTDLFRVYGAVSKAYGSSRVLSSVYTENSSPRKISWIGFWKNAALNGQTDRQVLCAAGTKLQRLETNGTLTALTGAGLDITESWIEGLPHMAQKSGDLMFITNQNPDLIGNGNTLVKYDGLEITRWGLLAPGEEPNVTHRITSVGATPPTGPNNTWIPTNGSAVADSITTRDGYAISMTKTSTGSTNAYIQTVLATPLNAHAFHYGSISLYVFIPLGELTKLASANALDIFMGSTTQVSSGITIPNFSANSYRWQVPIGELFEGWNLVTLGTSATSTDEAFDSRLIISGSVTLSNLQSIRLGINADATATLPAGIRWSLLRSFTRGSLTSAEGSAGTVFANADVFSYKVTFVNKQGFESNAGPKNTDLTLTAGRDTITITNIPVSADNQVIARKLYRTVAGGSLWIFVDRIEDNTTTTYTDAIADIALGETSPPEAGDVSIDHSVPPLMGIIKAWRRTIFGAGDPSNPNSVYFSDFEEAEGFPQLNIFTLDAKVTAIYETYSALIVETELGKWQVTGDNPDFRFDKIINNIGCVGRRAAGETRIEGWAIDRDGLRLYDANNPVKISEPIRDKFETFTKTYIEYTHSRFVKNDNAIIMCIPGETQYNFNADNFVYQYPVDEVGQGWWWKLQLPSSVNILDLEEVEDDNGDFHLYFGSTDGMIYELFDRDSKDWATATSSEPITTTITTKWLRLGQLGEQSDFATGRVSPRLIEMITDGDACTWTVTVETATGPEQAVATSSVTIPIVFGDTNERLMRYPVKNTLQPGEYIRITATQGTTNVASRILRLRLSFHVQPGQFVVESGAFNAAIDGVGE
jgi:hypothetical protein